MSKRAPKFSIILAGGKGTRMQSVNLHKVCFPLDGRPAINHSIDVYKSCGVLHNIVVVGAMAGQVIETIGRDHEGIIFAYQSEQLGTAHAARQGARILKALGETEDVLIVAGDRVVEPQVLEQLFDLFYSQNCDLAFLVQPKIRSTELGRVLLYPDGAVMANVEVRDIWQRQIYGRIRSSAMKGESIEGAKIKELIRQKFSEAKAAVAFGPLWKTVSEQGRDPSSDELLESIPEEMTRFDFTDQKGGTLILTPEEVEATNLYNSSIYLVKSEALHYVLDNLNRENAQNEEYLPDLITLLAQTRKDGEALYRVRALKVDNPHYIMAFNDPAELLEIENYFQSQKEQRVVREIPTGPAYRPISDWIRAFQNLYGSGKKEKELWTEMSRLYSEDAEFIHRKAGDYLKTLEYGSLVLDPDEPVSLVRSPGRVNMMGRHVDHQGGHCNLMTIGFETLMVVHPRTDDRVCLYNLDKTRFPDRDFSIGDLVAELPWEDWISLVNSDKVSHLALSAGGDWAQYVKAGVLRLQKKFATRKLRGVDMVVHGDIPIAAGLSSSSALVVATAEAMVAVNQLDSFPSQLVNLCGEGEWFVGTRGGSADHAAIKFGQRSKIVKVTFFEFAVEDIVTFPEGYVLAVCDSGFKAQKTANAKDQFNHRVACYRLGLLLVKKLFPHYGPLLAHLRDVNTRRLGVPLASIYKILLRLPERATRGEL
ncbi:MAG TPA: NTP transferase domain-containing protein, partial [Spirochaetia bacterium]|nr:NTP transferase domain-containing protein [Spirochaetia bacterium]